MKKNMLKGICTAAVCIALSAFGSNNSAQAASANLGDNTFSAAYLQDTTMQRNKMNKGKSGGKMQSDSTGKMGKMKGKSSGEYKNKGTGKSKMDTTKSR